MSLIDGIVLTLLNTVACLALPKLLSIIIAAKIKNTAQPPESSSEIPSFS
ncbi:hypothetical protein Cylst_4770 [Cylindrospermum stagnale PCC 7417]|uniref:Uncharacterized protein n=1 Tax=Cylindrospermum stagnale PCC 7417 TaxID=56107 RepID=K9X445_9NOST|nr:hypothetical protein Cylst_4770 [Cylindrospermum stagnale PCC 7417]